MLYAAPQIATENSRDFHEMYFRSLATHFFLFFTKIFHKFPRLITHSGHSVVIWDNNQNSDYY